MPYTSASIHPSTRDAFHRAGRYPGPAARPGPEVREGSRRRNFEHSERHLQCVWIDPRLRPRQLKTMTGESVRVLDPGTWNLEAGPDFLGAVLELGPQQRRLLGDVEVHIRPAGWKNHGHANEVRFSNVRVHVTYFPGRVDADLLPPGAVEIPLQKPLAANPTFSFDAIDVTAYPYGQRATVPPCSEVLREWNPDEKALLLDAAGEERLRRKADRLGAAIEERGQDQTLYEEVLAALGYKHNKAAFRKLAELVPHDELRAAAKGDVMVAFAILAGVSGLLPERMEPRWEPAARTFLRRVWDLWWREQAAWSERRLARSHWRLSGLRPANHPLRRCMAAAALFTDAPALAERCLRAATTNETAKALMGHLVEVTGPFWDRHLALSSKASEKPIALMGASRARGILVNVFVPFLAACGGRLPFDEGILNHLPAEEKNSLVRQAAFFLFGPDHSESLYRSGLRKQGLLQIFHDFCLGDRTRCLACPFPQMLRTHRDRLTGRGDDDTPGS